MYSTQSHHNSFQLNSHSRQIRMNIWFVALVGGESMGLCLIHIGLHNIRVRLAQHIQSGTNHRDQEA